MYGPAIFFSTQRFEHLHVAFKRYAKNTNNLHFNQDMVENCKELQNSFLFDLTPKRTNKNQIISGEELIKKEKFFPIICQQLEKILNINPILKKDLTDLKSASAISLPNFNYEKIYSFERIESFKARYSLSLLKFKKDSEQAVCCLNQIFSFKYLKCECILLELLELKEARKNIFNFSGSSFWTFFKYSKPNGSTKIFQDEIEILRGFEWDLSVNPISISGIEK